MQTQKIDCPSCGASVSVPENGSKAVCKYCGKEIIIEAKVFENIGDKVSSSFRDEESKTQLEIKRLQSSQELSILQMQLSNLRSEKRNLERNPNKANRFHLQEIAAEEADLNKRISIIQCSLIPTIPSSEVSSQINPQFQNTHEYQPANVYNSIIETPKKSWWTTFILAVLLGPFGAHRFYTNHIKTAILYLFTAGLFGIGWIVDIILILCNKFKDGKGRELDQHPKVGLVIAKIIGGIIIWFISFGIILSTPYGTMHPDSAGIIILGLLVFPLLIVYLFNFNYFTKKIIQLWNNWKDHSH